MSNATARPDLSGLLIQQPGTYGIYLIVNGTKRLIPDPDTLKRLFIHNPTIIPWDVPSVESGPMLSVGAVLVRADGFANTYVVTNGVRWFIPSDAVFNRYQFNRANVVVVPAIVINSVPPGPDLEMPTPQMTA